MEKLLLIWINEREMKELKEILNEAEKQSEMSVIPNKTKTKENQFRHLTLMIF